MLTLANAFENVDADTIHHTLRYYLSERFDDPTADEMREALVGILGLDLDEELAALSANPLLLENTALHVLSAAWQEEGQAARITEITAEAKAKLPVIEVALICIAAMYGLYLLRTGGIKRSERTTIRKPDGSFEEKVKIEYADPVGPAAALSRLLRRMLPPS
jgi:hypothetical protein